MNTFDLRLDLDKCTIVQVVTLRQGDVDGTLVTAAIYDHDLLADLTSIMRAYIEFTLPDGKHYYRKEAAVDAATSTLSVLIDEREAASVAGRTGNAYFSLSDGNSEYSTASFVVSILRDATDGMEVAETYDNEIEAAIQACHDAASSITVVDGAITTQKLASDAVTTPKIAGGAVTHDKLADAVRRGYVRAFDTAEQMQEATDLQAGMVCHTDGFHAAGDGGAAYYTVGASGTADGMGNLSCQGGMVASLVEGQFVTPEQFGARGDGTTNDTASINAAIASGRTVRFHAKTYLVGQVAVNGASNVTLDGNGATLQMAYAGSNGKTILGIVNSENIDVRGLHVTTDFGADDGETTIGALFTSAPYGISVNDSSRVRVSGCDVSLVKDGLGSNGGSEVTFSDNRIYNIGQEPIAVRQTRNVTVSGNKCYWHLGDGILVKFYVEETLGNIIISNNILHDPKSDTQSGQWPQTGGGITVNAENTATAYLTEGLVISDNVIDGCRYGVQIANVGNATVTGNIANVGLVNGAFDGGSCAFGLALASAWSPSTPNTMRNILFSNNVAIGGRVQFRSYQSANDVPIESIVFDGNVGISNGSVPSDFCAYVRNTTFVNNTVSGANRIGEFFNCIVRGNTFSDPATIPETPQTSDCYFRSDTCIVEGNVFNGHQVYFNCGVLARIVGNEFNLDEPQGIKLNCNSDAHIWLDGNTFNGVELVDANVYFGGTTANILTDFYRRYSLVVDETEVGSVHANRDTLAVYIDADYVTGTPIATVSDAYFRPTAYRQMLGFVAGDYSVARVSYQNDGRIYVRAVSASTGHLIVNTTMHK